MLITLGLVRVIMKTRPANIIRAKSRANSQLGRPQANMYAILLNWLSGKRVP